MSGEKKKNPAGIVMTTVGGILGMVGVAAWLIGLKMTLTPGLQEVQVYQGLFAASFSLIALGAVIGRRINSEHKAEETKALNESAPAFNDMRERDDEKRSRESGRSRPL